MQPTVLVFVIFVAFTSTVLAKNQEHKIQAPVNTKATIAKESSFAGETIAKPLKKQPNVNGKKPSPNKKPASQTFEEKPFAEQEKPFAVVKKPTGPAIKNPIKQQPTADASVPQPPKRGDKPPAIQKLEPDVVEYELPFDLPKPPSPPTAFSP